MSGWPYIYNILCVYAYECAYVNIVLKHLKACYDIIGILFIKI